MLSWCPNIPFPAFYGVIKINMCFDAHRRSCQVPIAGCKINYGNNELWICAFHTSHNMAYLSCGCFLYEWQVLHKSTSSWCTGTKICRFFFHLWCMIAGLLEFFSLSGQGSHKLGWQSIMAFWDGLSYGCQTLFTQYCFDVLYVYNYCELSSRLYLNTILTHSTYQLFTYVMTRAWGMCNSSCTPGPFAGSGWCSIAWNSSRISGAQAFFSWLITSAIRPACTTPEATAMCGDLQPLLFLALFLGVRSRGMPWHLI